MIKIKEKNKNNYWKEKKNFNTIMKKEHKKNFNHFKVLKLAEFFSSHVF